MIKSKNRRDMPPRPDSPSARQVASARSAAGLSAVAAGNIICVSGRAWTKYESGVKPVRMNGALWRYFCMVTNQFELL